MRALSLFQASNCEQARTKRCKCRCGGQFHGAGRVSNVQTLPADDPHHPGKKDFPLLEEVSEVMELPTVAEWLKAGAPMREMTGTARL